MMSLVIWLSAAALAGSGPWTQHVDEASVYVGTEAQQIHQFILSDGNFSDTEPVQVDDGFVSFFAKAIASYGLTPRADVEVQVPYGYVHANTEGGPLCTALGMGACETTTGFAPISVRAKMNWLEQAYGAPFSAAAGLELRHGDHTAAERQRLTNLGEGTFDTGLFASVGRSSALPGSGYYYTFLDVLGRYRFPATTSQGHAVPGAEFVVTGDLMLVPNGRIGFGPTINTFDRPAGVDFEEADLTIQDRFAALRVRNWAAGGKLTLAAGPKASASLSAVRSFYAENNPLVTSIGFGVSFTDVLPDRPSTDEEE